MEKNEFGVVGAIDHREEWTPPQWVEGEANPETVSDAWAESSLQSLPC